MCLFPSDEEFPSLFLPRPGQTDSSGASHTKKVIGVFRWYPIMRQSLNCFASGQMTDNQRITGLMTAGGGITREWLPISTWGEITAKMSRPAVGCVCKELLCTASARTLRRTRASSRQIDKEIDKQIDREVDGQIEIDRSTDRWTDWLIDWFIDRLKVIFIAIV